MRTHFDTLCVPPEATTREIKHAFLRFARAFHPDHDPSPEAKRRFQEVEAAYTVLKDRNRRRDYRHKLGIWTAPAVAAWQTEVDPAPAPGFSEPRPSPPRARGPRHPHRARLRRELRAAIYLRFALFTVAVAGTGFIASLAVIELLGLRDPAPPPPVLSTLSPAQLVILTEPADAEVVVDGKRLRAEGNAEPVVVDLAAGQHLVTVYAAFHADERRRVDLRPGTRSGLHLSLARAPNP